MSHRIKNRRKTVGRERNNSCPCGSGLKYKKCCGKHIRVVRTEPEPTEHNQPVVAEEYNSPEKMKAFLSRVEMMAKRGW